MMGLAAVTVGAVKLSGVSWTSQSAPAIFAQTPGVRPAPYAFAKPGQPEQDAEDTAPGPTDNFQQERVATDVAKKQPNSPFAMVMGTIGPNGNARAQARSVANVAPSRLREMTAPANVAPVGQVFIYKSDEQQADTATNPDRAPQVTLVAQASLTTGASMQRPVELPISFGKPPAPETDFEPVSVHWRHHGIVKAHSGFLPGPAAVPAQVTATTTATRSSVDAIAQICRIPSLMH
jgi:hypothetical protein